MSSLCCERRGTLYIVLYANDFGVWWRCAPLLLLMLQVVVRCTAVGTVHARRHSLSVCSRREAVQFAARWTSHGKTTSLFTWIVSSPLIVLYCIVVKFCCLISLPVCLFLYLCCYLPLWWINIPIDSLNYLSSYYNRRTHQNLVWIYRLIYSSRCY